MTVRVKVDGGTGAGTRKPFQGQAEDWICPECDHEIAGYWGNCPNCGERRPT